MIKQDISKKMLRKDSYVLQELINVRANQTKIVAAVSAATVVISIFLSFGTVFLLKMIEGKGLQYFESFVSDEMKKNIDGIGEQYKIFEKMQSGNIENPFFNVFTPEEDFSKMKFDDVPSYIPAKNFVLTDSEGYVRALMTTKGKQPIISLIGKNGKSRAHFFVDNSNNPALVMFDTTGAKMILVRYEDNEPYMGISNSKTNQGIIMGEMNNAHELIFRGNNHATIMLTSDEQDKPDFRMLKDGSTRLSVSIEDSVGPSIKIFDENRNLLKQFP